MNQTQTIGRKSITHKIKSKMIHTLNSARGGNSSRRERNNMNMSVDFASGGFKRSGTRTGHQGNNFNTANDEEDEQDMREVIQILGKQIQGKSKEITDLKDQHRTNIDNL